MATVYSLICWAGKDGKSVTVSSSTDYVTLTNHGLRDGTGVAFTGGTLPTVSGAALALNTTYYTKSISSSTYELYYDAGLTNKINFTSNGSSLVMKSAYYLGLMDTSRWGARIYDGIQAWNSGRSGASAYDVEVCEIGEAFTEVISNHTFNVPCASFTITTMVNGVRSSAYHGGVYGQGYIVERAASGSANLLRIDRYRSGVDGFTARFTGTGSYGMTAIDLLRPQGFATRMIVAGQGAGIGSVIGIRLSILSFVASNLVFGFSARGISPVARANGQTVANNTCVANNIGIGGTTLGNIYGYFYNNISLGNTTNWAEATGIEGAGYNAGLSTDTPWDTLGGTSVAMTTSDFADFAGGNYYPAASTSPQVEAAVEFYGAYPNDIADRTRPNYIDGLTDKYDIGAHEWDHGNGEKPNAVTVSGAGIVDGTRIKIAKQSDGSELRNVVLSGTTSDSFTQNASTNIPVYVYARKGSAAPFYKPVRISATITPAAGLSYDLAGLQIEDIARGPSYPAGVATDWSFNAGTGAITHDSGSTIYTVQDLYSYYRDYTDDSATVDDTLLMEGTTPTVFSLINSGTITDAHLQYLKGGSVEYQDGTLWSNVYSVGTLAGTPDIYLYQNGSKLTAFWPAGHLDVLIKVANAGTLIDAGLVTGYTRKWGYTYDNYEADLSGGGRSVMPLATATDPAITESTATVAGWTDITVSFGSYSLDFADGDGAQTYYARIDCNGRPLAEVYQRMQYLTREGATATLNGVAGERYAAAHASLSPIKAAPFGLYSGGVWSLAQGVWLDNVGSGDLYNFVLTDASGGAHQNVVALFQSVTIAGLTIGSRVQIYDTTNDLELFNDIATATSVSWEDDTAPAGDRAIRLRVAYVDGADARNFIEASIGTCGTASGNKDVSFLVSQTPDAVYNANAIDGSAVAGVTFTDSTVDVMNIDIDAGEVNLGQLYAAWVWYAFSETGITTDIDYIQAIDQANYIYTNLRWKNTTSPSVPLKITGGYAWDVGTEDPIDLVDTSGGTIFLAPPHVVAKTITVSGSSVITGDIADLPTAAEVAVAVLAAAESDPIHADAKRMNGAAIAGTGAEGDLWRGA